MPFTVRPVITGRDREAFLRLPWRIYEDDPRWTPPLLADQRKFFDPARNPFFDHAEVALYLAFDSSGQPAGRIALTVDRAHNEFHSERTGFFGFFESIDDPRAGHCLLDHARQWFKDKGLAKMAGPMNLSTNHECGLLVEGFESLSMLGIPYNPPRYQEILEGWGLAKSKDLLSLFLDPKVVPEYLTRAMVRIDKRNRFTLRSFRMDRFTDELDILWDIYNSAWERNWGFVPMTRKEFLFAAEEMKAIVQPEFCFIAEVEGQPVGFSLTLPNINPLLKKMNGRLFPLGWLHFLRGKKNIDSFRVITLGIKKPFRRMGIDVAFYHATYKRLVEITASLVEMSWILEDNIPMLEPIRRIGGTVYKRHRIYERNLND